MTTQKDLLNRGEYALERKIRALASEDVEAAEKAYSAAKDGWRRAKITLTELIRAKVDYYERFAAFWHYSND